MSVGGVGGSRRDGGGGVGGVKGTGPGSLRADNASLTADPDGQLTLSPLPDLPVKVSKGQAGRYNVSVGDQDIQFTPEQMGRLNIAAGANNPVNIGKDVDLPVNVNGRAHGPDGPLKGKGYDSVPGMAGDRYEAGRAGGPDAAADKKVGLPQRNAVDDARKADANRAVNGNNWDSAGVPGAQGEQASPEEAKKGEEKDKAKKGKRVDIVDVPTTGPEEVKIINRPDSIRVEFHKNDKDLWNKMMSNMSGTGSDGLDMSNLKNQVNAMVAGARAEQLERRLDEIQQSRMNTRAPSGVGGAGGTSDGSAG